MKSQKNVFILTALVNKQDNVNVMLLLNYGYLSEQALGQSTTDRRTRAV